MAGHVATAIGGAAVSDKSIAVLNRKRCGAFQDENGWFQCKYLDGHGGPHVYPDPVKWAQGLEHVEEGPPPDLKKG